MNLIRTGNSTPLNDLTLKLDDLELGYFFTFLELITPELVNQLLPSSDYMEDVTLTMETILNIKSQLKANRRNGNV